MGEGEAGLRWRIGPAERGAAAWGRREAELSLGAGEWWKWASGVRERGKASAGRPARLPAAMGQKREGEFFFIFFFSFVSKPF